MRLIYIEKKETFRNENTMLQKQLNELLGTNIEDLRILNRYKISGLQEEELKEVGETLLGEKNIEYISEEIEDESGYAMFAVSLLKGQFDQRADSAEQCIKLIYPHWEGHVENSKVYMIKGDLSEGDMGRIKDFIINKVDSCEIDIDNIGDGSEQHTPVEKIKSIENFRAMDEKSLAEITRDSGLAMNLGDMKHIQEYFKKIDREPTETELRVFDTYWSDHCRHTTFNTEIEKVQFEKGEYSDIMEKTYEDYLHIRENLGREKKPLTLMDLAVIGMRELKRLGKLDNLDISEEINACSIDIKVDNDGVEEDWLLMFKNETHNHPTEIEPFGGASTCVGGAIRDPLSGRSYVYGAMRVTGAGDPRESIEDTIKGKLPQIKITREAARGYSSYGNQIGLATGLVSEVYHKGYKAKRMEVGAVIGAAKKENVIRCTPEEGDKVLLIGGRTGRDGVGGASGSSKEHTEDSMEKCGAEVQKGNPPVQRKIQRLFRDSEAARMIKRCNDFGAGGVAVAVGEIAEGLVINLDNVRKKYQGLNGTELAISESQERMAVVVSEENVQRFIELCQRENVECYEIALVTKEKKMIMMWQGEKIVDIDREFLDTNGASSRSSVMVASPKKRELTPKDSDFKEIFMREVKSLNRCSQRGLVDQFDSTIGSRSVLMPFGGKFGKTPVQSMVHKIPVKGGKTETVSAMSYGFNVDISEWSPFHGGITAVLENISKLVATGADYTGIRLSFQEYFEKLGSDEKKWGKPFAALLGAMKAQMEFGTAAIGGKDSMSGTFKDISVPPTLISFGVSPEKISNITTPEFKKAGSPVVLLQIPYDNKMMPDFHVAREIFTLVRRNIERGMIKSAYSISGDSIYSALCKMCFGNRIGLSLNEAFKDVCSEQLYGSIICEVEESAQELLNYGVKLGNTQEDYTICIDGENISLESIEGEWDKPLEEVFSMYNQNEPEDIIVKPKEYTKKIYIRNSEAGKPKILIPVFPGTNCEYDSIAAFKRAGGSVKSPVFKNLTEKDIRESILKLREDIDGSNIIMLPGGFSAGDEPDGSGKFIASIFRNQEIKEGVMDMLYKRDGLMIGVCNGFQALVKLGLVPFGDIREVSEEAPTLTNNCGRKHISRIVKTRIVSNKSPWMNGGNVGDIHSIPVSHGEGRFYAGEKILREMEKNGQIATVYHGENPNGSIAGIEGITSPDGRILGKMGHSERIGKGLYKNIHGKMDQKIFTSGVEYFK